MLTSTIYSILIIKVFEGQQREHKKIVLLEK